MKTKTIASKFLPISAALAVAALLTLSASAKADVPVQFSGGNGTPITLTLTSPISYTITAAASSGNAPGFVIANTGDIFSNPFPALTVTGNITFSINGGGSFTLDTGNISSGHTYGDVTSNDLFFYNLSSQPGVSVGDVVTLSTGYLTTTTNVAGTGITGDYSTFVSDDNLNQISYDGVTAVPEPSAFALLGLAGVGFFFFRKRPLAKAVR